MPGSDAVLFWRLWTHKLTQILIILILLNRVLCEDKTNAELQSQICTSSVHDITYDLRFNLLVKEKKIREKFMDLGEYTINGIVETIQEVENLYRAINPKKGYIIETDSNRDDIITCREEVIKLQNQINDGINIHTNKSDNKYVSTFITRLEERLEKLENRVENHKQAELLDKWMKILSEDIKAVSLKFDTKLEELNLKLKDYNKDMKLPTKETDNVKVSSETSFKKNGNVKIDEEEIEENVEERVVFENDCLKTTECRKKVGELILPSDVNKISEFVRNIYRDEKNFGFPIILTIAQGVSNFNIQLIIYKTLHSELSNNLDLNILIKFYGAVKSLLIQEKNFDNITKNTVQQLLDSTLLDIKTVTDNNVKDYLKNPSTNFDTVIRKELFEDIYRIDKEFCAKLLESLVYEIYDGLKRVNKNEFKSLLIFIRQYWNLDLRVVGMLAFYNRIKNERGSKDVLFNVLSYIKDILHTEMGHPVTGRAKNRIETALLPQLPPCYRALISFEHFCIKNIGQSSYISAFMYNEKQINDTVEQPKFTTFNSTNEIPVGGEWTILHLEDEGFHIHNNVLNKYLYAASFGLDENNRYVYVCPVDDVSIRPSFWFIVAKDNYCYIQNIYGDNMYVYSDPNSNTGNSKDLLSLVTRRGSLNVEDSSYFLWELVGCH